MLERIVANLEGDVTIQMLEGEEHLVVPMVMITEGVHNGSEGPGYYPADVNERSAPAWNHMPIVVYHPTGDDGNAITARQPDVLNARKVGVVLNAEHYETKEGDKVVKKLGAKAWLNITRTKSIDARILDNIKNKVKTEVSTGLGATRTKKKGKWNGEKYDWVVKDIIPDHLAILPDQVGACSIADGAGLLANAAATEGTALVLHRSLSKVVENALGMTTVKNEMSFSSISRSLCDLLSAKYGQPGKYWDGYVGEVYKDKVIFYGEDRKLYVIGYTATDAGVSLSGDATEVVRVVKYQTKDGKSYVANESHELTPTPVENEKMFDKKAHIAALIANGVVSAESQTMLEAMTDDQLKALKVPAPVVNKEGTPPPAPPQTIVINNTPAAPKQATVAEHLASLPPEIRSVVNRALQTEAAAKTRMIDLIVANKKNQFSKEFLQQQDPDFLERLSLLAVDDVQNAGSSPYGPPIVANYSGAAGYHPTNNVADEETMEIPVENYSAPAEKEKIKK